jgi:hypothetical protein
MGGQKNGRERNCWNRERRVMVPQNNHRIPEGIHVEIRLEAFSMVVLLIVPKLQKTR